MQSGAESIAGRSSGLGKPLGLTSEDPQRVYETIHSIASEGLTLLWPDLDRLADAEDVDVAHQAREALERMCEDLERKKG